jgi:biotin carboxylase
MSSLKGKNILIVGGGLGQLPAIFSAKDLGAKVIVVDKNPEAPGMKYADQSYLVDIIDEKAVLEVAKNNAIDFAFTMQSDHGVKSVAKVNDNIGAKAYSYETAQACSNKSIARKLFDKAKVSQPNFLMANTIEECINSCNSIGFPCLIKCPDSSGSRGITKVQSIDEIEPAFNEALKWSLSKKSIVVEEFIEGFEFGAQTFSIEGNCEVVILHNDQLSNPPYMIPTGHSMPFHTSLNFDFDKIKEEIKKAVDALKIINGPANVDVIYDTNREEVKIIEISARIGATCLPELLLFHTGVDWVKMSLLCFESKFKKTDLVKKNKSVAAKILYSNKSGLLSSISSNDPKLLSDLTLLEFNCKIGDKVSLLKKGTDRIGSALLASEKDIITTEKDLDKIINSITFGTI